MSKILSVPKKIASKNSLPIVFEASNLAKLADGACTCSLGDTCVLVTAVAKEQQRPSGNSHVPLTVDYRQKAAALGRIPMTHLRRDIGVTVQETLIGRMIDRSIRPVFPKGFRFDTQIFCDLLAVDGENNPDILAINGASASLALSDIPWNGPIGAVRVGQINDDLVINPSRREQQNSKFNLVVAANKFGNLMMLDGSCREPITLNQVGKAIKQGTKEAQKVIEAISNLAKFHGKPKREIDLSLVAEEKHINAAISLSEQKLKSIFQNFELNKISRDEEIKAVMNSTVNSMKEMYPETDSSILIEAFSQASKRTYRQLLRETKIRCDGRQLADIRPIKCGVNLYKPLHGSALFQRGQTQVFCSATFDSVDAAIKTSTTTMLTGGIKEKNFMLHYEFPPFATNEIGRVSTLPGRREVGHGALAEKALLPLVPEIPNMTLRLNCEVLESNGSSSMASVCAGSLSLMDAGVNINEHVAGVAMGLISDLDKHGPESKIDPTKVKAFVLTDIMGLEDYMGDMDLKVAGTKKCLTAIQLDVKPTVGLPLLIMTKALQKAHNARAEIIAKMDAVINKPRQNKNENHPVIKSIYVPPHKKSKFLGLGGANLKRLTSQIGVKVYQYTEGIDEDPNEGDSSVTPTFTIFAPNKGAMDEAEEFIKTILDNDFKEPELEFGAIYTATIQEILPHGVLVTLYPSMSPALLPLSQLDLKTVRHPSALNLDVGQEIQVKYFGRDPATGHMRLSRKVLLMSHATINNSPLG